MRRLAPQVVVVVVVLAHAPAAASAGAGQAPSPAASASPPPSGEEPRTRELAGPRWVLKQIGDEAPATPQAGDAFLAFDAKLMRFSGSGGCNRITGGYRPNAAGRLWFGEFLTTRMACPNLDDEAAFLRALGLTRRYRIDGRHLELLDESGRQVARLEAASDR